MKTVLLAIGLLVSSGFVYSQEETEEPTVVEEPAAPEEIFDTVEEVAEFPGGQPALAKFLMQNIVYPPTAMQKNKQGKCYLKFVVSKSGRISNVTVSKGVPNCPECDAEAVRVVKKMPKWTPGKMNGKAVNTYFILPIAFRLS